MRHSSSTSILRFLRQHSIALLVLAIVIGQQAPAAARALFEEPGTPRAAVPAQTAFTYQGRITEDGLPKDGMVTLILNIWDAASGGDIVYDKDPIMTQVTNGVFSVVFEPGATIFEGERRWIETIVNGTSLGRVEMTATPYAVYSYSTAAHDHLEETWTGTSVADTLTINTPGVGIDASSTAMGLVGRNGACAPFVFAKAGVAGCRPLGASGPAVGGQWGDCTGLSVNNAGVFGCGEGNSGVYGVSNGSYGVWGNSTSTGVYGTSTTGRGVFGVSSSSDGVRGDSTSASGVSGNLGVCNPIKNAGVVGCSAAGSPGMFAQRGTCATLAITNAGLVACDGSNRAVFGQSGTCAQLGATAALQGCSDLNAGVAGRSNEDPGAIGESTLNYGVSGIGHAAGLAGAAVHALAQGAAGVAIYAQNNSTDTTLVLEQGGSGDLIRGFDATSGFVFQVTDDGNVRADGTFASPATDLAEIVPANFGLEPGDVVEIDPGTGMLRKTTTAFSTLVAGVVSTKPGVLLGTGVGTDSDGIALALAGRVPVKASGEAGVIRPGDLLVASSTPGFAMRAGANPAPGTVIGKAMESLDAATGTVIMLVVNR